MASLYNLIFLVAFIVLPLAFCDAAQTEYNMYVKTGDVSNAGTNAVVGIRLYDSYGETYEIRSLVAWGGAMGQGHDYYERGDLDAFKGVGPLLSDRVCKIELFHDNGGNKPGWYVDFVSVGTEAGFMRFDINQWLARDEPPYQLSTIRDKCGAAGVAMVL